ncbi:unnamed protein product [Urochloa humidicola]
MADHLLFLLLTAASSSCITVLTSSANPPAEALFAFVLWALASAALAAHLPRVRRGGGGAAE